MKKILTQITQKQTEDDKKALSFIAIGVACYAFSLIDELGILAKLYRKGIFAKRKILSYPNPLVLQSAFQTLEKNGVVCSQNTHFSLTDLGKGLFKHRGSIGLICNGYRNVLANQFKIASDQPSYHLELIDSVAVSKASVSFSNEFLDEVILKSLLECPFQGIADLGCGEGHHLISLCRQTGLHGIGFDLSKLSIRKARAMLRKNEKIKLFQKDISKLDTIYPDIEILLQKFVMHDLPDDLYIKTMNLFLSKFPMVKMFIYVDAFAPDDNESPQLPGFDYIHSLLNIKTRTKRDTTHLLKYTGFRLQKEFPVEGLPNCYMWILVPT